MKIEKIAQIRFLKANKNIGSYLEMLEKKDYSLIPRKDILRLIKQESNNLFSIGSPLVTDFYYDETGRVRRIYKSRFCHFCNCLVKNAHSENWNKKIDYMCEECEKTKLSEETPF